MFVLTREVLVDEQDAQLIHQRDLHNMYFDCRDQSPPNCETTLRLKTWLQSSAMVIRHTTSKTDCVVTLGTAKIENLAISRLYPLLGGIMDRLLITAEQFGDMATFCRRIEKIHTVQLPLQDERALIPQ